MFEWKPPGDKFRIFAWAVVALLLGIVFNIAAVRPYRQWQYEQDHPEFYGYPDSTKCPSGSSPSPDGRYIVYNDNPCLYSPYGTVVAICGVGEPERDCPDQDTNAVLNMRSGGPVYVIWKTDRQLLIVCRHCREQDAWFVKRQFREVTIDYRFEGYDEPLPEYITGKHK